MLLQYFEDGWLVRVHKVLLGDREEAGSGLGSFLPVFVFVFTKMLRVEGRPAMKVRDGMTSSFGIYCTLIVLLCRLSYMASRPVSSDIG